MIVERELYKFAPSGGGDMGISAMPVHLQTEMRKSDGSVNVIDEHIVGARFGPGPSIRVR